MDIITSSQNSLVKKIKALSTGKGRKRFCEFIAEGNKFVLNIPKDWEITNTIFSESYALNNNAVLSSAVNPVIFSDRIFNSISDAVTPAGVLAVIKIKEFSISDILSCSKKFIILACNLQDPGNMGTLIRTANAVEASGVIVSPECADIWSPKVVRATAGSVFNIPIAVMDIELAAKELKANGISLVATDLSASLSPYQADFTKPLALMIGNESNGLSAEMLALSDVKVKLPMSEQVESLNASVASGVLMYEVLRQRG